METLTPPKTEILQPNYDLEMEVHDTTVAYHQNPNARRTEYAGNSLAVIDGGEKGQKDSLGTFEMGETSLPVVAKFTVENKPNSYNKDAALESEFLVVDIRGLGISDTAGTSIHGFKAAAEIGQRFGRLSSETDAPQFALVNLTGIQRYSEGRGGIFSISTISRNPAEPTIIRRDHTLYGEATADSLSAIGLGESNINISSDENGKIVVSMAQESNTPLQVDTANELLDEYKPQYAAAENSARAEQLYWENKLLGESALHGLFTPETFSTYAHYKAAYDQFSDSADFWLRARNFNFDDLTYKDRSDDVVADTITNVSGADAMPTRPLQTTEDVHNRIADMRRANVSDKDIKKTLLKEVHPDFNPDVNPELAKVVTDEFRPKPQEYRNESVGASATSPEHEPEPATTADSGVSNAAASSTEVVPVAAPASQAKPGSGDYSTAA